MSIERNTVVLRNTVLRALVAQAILERNAFIAIYVSA